MAQPAARGVCAPQRGCEPARRRARTRAAAGGRSSRIDELFAEDSAASVKRPVAKKETAAKQPALSASVLAEPPPPPADARGSTTAVGVQAAVTFFAVGLVWQLWPLLALCVPLPELLLHLSSLSLTRARVAQGLALHGRPVAVEAAASLVSKARGSCVARAVRAVASQAAAPAARGARHPRLGPAVEGAGRLRARGHESQVPGSDAKAVSKARFAWGRRGPERAGEGGCVQRRVGRRRRERAAAGCAAAAASAAEVHTAKAEAAARAATGCVKATTAAAAAACQHCKRGKPGKRPVDRRPCRCSRAAA